MKKTLTVNLGGTVFHIDEDAYQLLDKYLSNLRIHFRKEEGSDEIMDDFEMRISELLNERVRLGYDERLLHAALPAAIVPILRQGQHLRQQSLGFQGQLLVSQMVV